MEPTRAKSTDCGYDDFRQLASDLRVKAASGQLLDAVSYGESETDLAYVDVASKHNRCLWRRCDEECALCRLVAANTTSSIWDGFRDLASVVQGRKGTCVVDDVNMRRCKGTPNAFMGHLIVDAKLHGKAQLFQIGHREVFDGGRQPPILEPCERKFYNARLRTAIWPPIGHTVD